MNSLITSTTTTGWRFSLEPVASEHEGYHLSLDVPGMGSARIRLTPARSTQRRALRKLASEALHKLRHRLPRESGTEAPTTPENDLELLVDLLSKLPVLARR